VRYSVEVIDQIEMLSNPTWFSKLGFSFALHIGEQWMAGSTNKYSKSLSVSVSNPALGIATLIAVYSELIRACIYFSAIFRKTLLNKFIIE
jgi:hypothetical protein